MPKNIPINTIKYIQKQLDRIKQTFERVFFFFVYVSAMGFEPAMFNSEF